MWFDLAHCAFKYWPITIIIIWTMSDNYLFNLKVRKIHVQKTSPWIRSMKIATQKGGIDNKWRQYRQNAVVEAAFNVNVTARTPIPKKATKLSILVDSTYLSGNAD